MTHSSLKTIFILTLSLILISLISVESGRLASGIVLADDQADPFTLLDSAAPSIEADCSFGVSWNDYDDDSYPDLFVTRWWPGQTRLNALYHNNGDGTFRKVTDLIPTQEANALGVTWGDYDNDGDDDVFLASFMPSPSGSNNRLYRNDGDGAFTKIVDGPVVTDFGFSVHALFADFDNDGDLDLMVGNHSARIASEVYYYRNEVGGFVRVPLDEIGLIPGDFGAVQVCDVDSDRDLDFVYARNQLTSRFYLNDGDGTFTSVDNVISTDSAGAFCWGDYDNDGDFDLCGMNSRSEELLLYRNDGKGGFERGLIRPTDTMLAGADGKPYWVDYDNDGDLDLLIVNQGERYMPMRSVLLTNSGGAFERVTNSVITTDSGASSGAAWADYDRDGDLDLYVARTNFGRSALYRNEAGSAGNWVSVKCVGNTSNRSGIGAKVRVQAKINGHGVWQLRQISSQSGFFGQDEMRAHFGLGDAALIDSLVIEWPSGMTDVRTKIASRQALTITEGSTGTTPH
jgi:hypothetical protein